MTAKKKPLTSQERKARRVKMKSKGICVICSFRKARPGQTLCVHCSIATQTYYHLRYIKFKEQGMCVDCGRLRPVAGKVRCKKCLAKVLASVHRHRAKVRAKQNGDGSSNAQPQDNNSPAPKGAKLDRAACA
jgi:hypothetical protein